MAVSSCCRGKVHPELPSPPPAQISSLNPSPLMTEVLHTLPHGGFKVTLSTDIVCMDVGEQATRAVTHDTVR